MADYISQFTGSEIDQRLAKVPQLESGKQDKLVSGSNIKTINGESVLGSGNIQVQAGDTDAVKYVSQELTEAQKAQARANIDAVSLADIENMDFVTATSLPTASASTMGHIYLIGPDANDNYDRYFTQESGGSYSWVPLGSTQIDLSTYATKAEVDELEAEVDENREELDNINLKVTGRIGVANSNADIDTEDLPEYTGQYGQVTLTVSGDAYLWVCLENESFRLTANGIDIPMVYVKEDGGLHCYVSAEKIKAGTLVFDITNLHPIKADGERVVITARSYTITYGDAMPDFGYIADGQVEGTPAITCEAVQGSDAGTYAIVIARGSVVDDNAIYVNGVLTIEKAELTVTADNKQVAVGGEMPVFTVQYSGFVLDEDESDLTTVPTCTTTAEDTATEENYPITPAGGVATNYSFTYVAGVLTVGDPVILTLGRQEIFDSGSCGGYIDTTSPYKFLTSTQYVGILIDVQKYRGMKVKVTKGVTNPARFAILKSATLTNNSAPTFSTASGFTGLINHAWGTGETEFEFTIPNDAVVMYVYKYNYSYPDTPMCHKMEIKGVPPTAEYKNLPASLFSTYTTIDNSGNTVTGSTNAPATVCSDYINGNTYCRLLKASFINNALPSGVAYMQVNIAEFDPNKRFIKRESYKRFPYEYTLAPSCKYIRVIVVCADSNGNAMSGDVIRFDNDDIQIEGVES